MANRRITRVALATLVLTIFAGQANAGFFTSPRFLVGKSKATITQCAGGDRIATKNNSWTYQSVGKNFYKHIWKNRPPRLSGSYNFSSPILFGNKCNVTFSFKNGTVSDVSFSSNVRGTQREFTCGIVTDRCLR